MSNMLASKERDADYEQTLQCLKDLTTQQLNNDAIIIGRALLKTYGPRPAVYEQIAHAQVQRRSYAEAESACGKAIDLAKGSDEEVDVYTLRVMKARIMLHEFGDAHTCRAVLGEIPENRRGAEVWKLLGDSYRGENDAASRVRCYSRVVDLCPLALHLLHKIPPTEKKAPACLEWIDDYVEALRKKRDLKYEEAASLLISVSRRAPHEYISLEQADLAWRQGKEDEAYAFLRSSMENDKYVVKHMDRLYFLARVRNEDELANVISLRLGSRSERFPETWTCRGWVEESKGMKEKALEMAKRAISIRKDYPEAWRLKGRVLFALKRKQEAVEAFQKYLNYEVSIPAYQGLLGCCLALRMEDTVVHLVRELERRLPNNPKAEVSAGMALAQIESHWPVAERKLRNLIEQYKAPNSACIAVVNIMSFQGRTAEAIRDMRQWLKNRQDEELHIKCAELYRASGKPHYAYLHFSEALKLNQCNERAQVGASEAEKELAARDPASLAQAPGGYEATEGSNPSADEDADPFA